MTSLRIYRVVVVAVVLLLTLSDGYGQLSRPYFYTRGRDLIIAGQYGEAIESLNMLLRSQEEEYEGYFLRGVAKYNLGDLHGAANDFSLAIEYNPVYTLAFQYRGITRSRMGDYNAALADFARAIEMRPSFSGAYYSRAVTSFLNQQFAASISDYDEFLRLEPLSAEGYVNRGTAKLYLKDTTSAMVDYNQAVKINPYYDDGYLRRGVLFLMQNETQKGINDMNSALSLDSTTAVAYFYRAMGNNQLGEINAALDDFGSAIRFDPTNSVAIFNRAILRSQIGDYNRAIEDYTLVASQNPDNVLVYYNRAAVYAQLGEIRKAIEDYTRAIDIYGDFANAYLYRANLRAMLRDKRGYAADKRKAEELINKYHNELSAQGEAAFSDTSARFSDIVSFDADFGNKNFSKLNSKTLNRYQPLPMYSITIDHSKDSVVGVDPMEFYDPRVVAEIESLGVEGLIISNKRESIAGWRLMELDTLYSGGESIRELFASAIISSQMNNYLEAIEIYSYLISEYPENPLPYINRAVAEAQGMEFSLSLEADYQSLAAQGDPAQRLNVSQGEQTTDLTSAISDLRRAAELLPELPYTFYNIAYMYTLEGNLPAAVEYYSKAIELYPYFGEAYYNRGLVQLSLDEIQKGALDLSRAGEVGIEEAYVIINEINKE